MSKKLTLREKLYWQDSPPDTLSKSRNVHAWRSELGFKLELDRDLRDAET